MRSTFKVFKHNFWTNDRSWFLFEGKFRQFKASDITKVKLRKTIINKQETIITVNFFIPEMRMPENGERVNIDFDEFPKYWKIKLKPLLGKMVGRNGNIRLPKKLEKDIKEYFAKRMKITKRQAKILLDPKIYGLTGKKLHKFHIKAGLRV